MVIMGELFKYWITLGRCIVLFFLVATFFSTTAGYAETVNKSADVGSKPESLNTSEVPIGMQQEEDLQYLLARDQQLARKKVDLQVLLAKIVKPAGFYEILQELQVKVNDLDWKITMAASDLHIANEQLAMYETRLEKISDRLERNSGIFQEHLAILLKQHMEWSETAKKLDREIANLEGSETYKLLENDILGMQEMSQQALTLLTERIHPLHEASNYADTLRVNLYALKARLRNTIAENRKGYFQQTSPPLYSKKFYTKLNIDLLQKMGDKTVALMQAQSSLLRKNFYHTMLLAVVVVLTWHFIRQSRKRIPASYRWYTINHLPLCSALFLCLVGYLVLVNYFLDTSTDLGLSVYFPLLLTLYFIRRGLDMTSWVKKFFSRTLLFLAATILIDAVNGPPAFFRMYMSATTVYGIIFSIKMNRDLRAQDSGHLSRFMFQSTAVFLLLVLAAVITGYDQFSRYIFIAFVRSLAAGLVCWVLYLYTTGLIEYMLKMVPLSFVNRHSATAIKQLTPLFWACYTLVFLLSLRQIWLLQPDAPNFFNDLFGLGISLFSWKITIGFVLTISAVLYGTYLFSSWMQTILLQDVMPRYNLERGVQLSISRIVHYTVFLAGFIILLKILGVQLTQLAILGGALGVGIGFGLQAIVNNFVSGLILLFERPVKVGDIIQVGQEWGEIKSLGLRATIVQTFDNAEIVIPNGDLITNKVTNWTLDERRVRLKLSVGVAYGSDISEVLNILRNCALEHPQVLTNPKPAALFLAFGASSLDFELRAWIANIDDKLSILSELNQEIESEFKAAGIVIPFPQTDVHLHTVTAEDE